MISLVKKGSVQVAELTRKQAIAGEADYFDGLSGTAPFTDAVQVFGNAAQRHIDF